LLENRPLQRNTSFFALSVGIAMALSCFDRMMGAAPSHHVQQVHPRLERTHHASSGLLEQAVGDVIEQMALELEINDEVDVSLVPKWHKRPCVCEVLQRPSFDGAHSHLSWSIQPDMAREALLEWTEPDGELSGDLSLILMADMSTAASRNEERIVLHVCHDCKKLVGTVGERCLPRMTRHAVLLSHVTVVRRARRAPSQMSSAPKQFLARFQSASIMFLRTMVICVLKRSIRPSAFSFSKARHTEPWLLIPVPLAISSCVGDIPVSC
jgi:hypothetical protein